MKDPTQAQILEDWAKCRRLLSDAYEHIETHRGDTDPGGQWPILDRLAVAMQASDTVWSLTGTDSTQDDPDASCGASSGVSGVPMGMAALLNQALSIIEESGR